MNSEECDKERENEKDRKWEYICTRGHLSSFARNLKQKNIHKWIDDDELNQASF